VLAKNRSDRMKSDGKEQAFRYRIAMSVLKFKGFRASLKTQNYPSLLVRKTPGTSGEKGRDEGNKKDVF